MKSRSLAILALLSGCAGDPPPPPVITVTAPVVPAKPKFPSPPVEVLVTPTAPSKDVVQIIHDASISQAEARRYVAYDKAKAQNINRLNSLVVAVQQTVRRMEHSQVHGHFDLVQVVVARQAVDALRVFLDTKSE